MRQDLHDLAFGGLVHPDLPGLRAREAGAEVMARRKTVHASAHTSLVVPPGYDRALCGELVPVARVRESGVTCRPCLDVAAKTLESAAEIAGSGQGPARRAVSRMRRRAGRGVGGGR